MSSSTMTSFPQFLSLPFTALRKVIRHAALDDLGKLMFDRQLAEYIYSLKVWAGAYCISFTGSAGVQVPLKTFDWTFDGPIEDTIQTVMEVYENLSSRFPGFLDTLVIDPFYMGMPDFPEFKQCNRLELVAQSGQLDDQPRIDSLLETLSISDSIKFDVQGCHLNIDKIVHLNDVKIEHATRWMCPQDLLKFTSKRLNIKFHDFDDIHVNEFIRQWINDEDPKLEMLPLGADRHWDAGVIISSCNAEKYDAERRDAVFNGIDMTAAVDASSRMAPVPRDPESNHSY